MCWAANALAVSMLEPTGMVGLPHLEDVLDALPTINMVGSQEGKTWSVKPRSDYDTSLYAYCTARMSLR